MAAEEAKREARERSIAAEWEYVSKQRAGQQKKGKARMRAYEELVEEAAAYVRNATLDSIVIPPGPRLGDIVVEAKGLVKGYGDRCLIDGLDFMIKPGSVVGVVGGNGAGPPAPAARPRVALHVRAMTRAHVPPPARAGKSTLFRMIMGQETPDGGVLRVGETVRPMCAEQLRDALPADKTVYQVLAENGDEIVIAGRPVNARAYCGWYGFKSGDQQKRVGDLSGGERNRLQLAKTLLQGGNLLLLDEARPRGGPIRAPRGGPRVRLGCSRPPAGDAAARPCAARAADQRPGQRHDPRARKRHRALLGHHHHREPRQVRRARRARTCDVLLARCAPTNRLFWQVDVGQGRYSHSRLRGRQPSALLRRHARAASPPSPRARSLPRAASRHSQAAGRSMKRIAGGAPARASRHGSSSARWRAHAEACTLAWPGCRRESS